MIDKTDVSVRDHGRGLGHFIRQRFEQETILGRDNLILFVHVTISHPSEYLTACLSDWLTIWLSVYAAIGYWSICLSIRLSDVLTIWQSTFNKMTCSWCKWINVIVIVNNSLLKLFIWKPNISNWLKWQNFQTIPTKVEWKNSLFLLLI